MMNFSLAICVSPFFQLRFSARPRGGGDPGFGSWMPTYVGMSGNTQFSSAAIGFGIASFAQVSSLADVAVLRDAARGNHLDVVVHQAAGGGAVAHLDQRRQLLVHVEHAAG